MKLVLKIKNNLLAALVISILFISAEQIFRVYNHFLVFNLDGRAFFEQLLIHKGSSLSVVVKASLCCDSFESKA